MRKIAVYGKGGVGKSTIVSNLSALNALGGKKVLQVGCDPKADSTILLCGDGKRVTILDVLREKRRLDGPEDVIMHGRLGIHCVESGGPAPGIGCGGRGVLRMLEVIEEVRLLEHGGYDLVIFDVLGDIVCGGFAAPLRMGFGELVFIVVSDDAMSVFAANNIARMALEYAENGIALGGLIANLRNNEANRSALEEFAAALGTTILGFIPQDPMFKKTAREGSTVVEAAPDSATAAAIAGISERIWGIDPGAVPQPTPMSNEETLRFLRKTDFD